MNISSNGISVKDIVANSRIYISGVNGRTLWEIRNRVHDVGYAVVSNVLNPGHVLDIRSKYFEMFPGSCTESGHVENKNDFEILIDGHGKDAHPSKMIQQSNEYQLLVKSSNLKSIAQHLAQSEVRLVNYLVLRNYSKFSSSATMAHFDEVYVNNPPKHMSNFWIPLGKASIKTGTLAYLPGSHRLNIYQLMTSYHECYGVRLKGGYPFGDNLDEIADYLGLGPWEYVELDPGSVVIHHPLILHSGTDSHSKYCRLSTDVRFVPRDWHGDKRWDKPWSADSMKEWPSM